MMSAGDTMYKELLNKHGLKATKSRLAILDYFKKCGKPLTAEEIYHALHKKEKISLSTVYRTLATLEETGVLMRNINMQGISYYQPNLHNHYHEIVCIRCGKRLPIESCPFHQIEEEIVKSTGFEITGHTIEFSGICPECQKEEEEKGNN